MNSHSDDPRFQNKITGPREKSTAMPSNTQKTNYLPYWGDLPEKYNIAVDVCDRKDPDRLAMIWWNAGEARHVTWDEIRDGANRFGNYFRRRGISAGDRIAFVLTGSPDTAAAILGALRIGAIIVITSHLWGEETLNFRLKDSQPALILTTSDRTERLRRVIAGPVVAIDDVTLQEEPTVCDAHPTRADDPAAIYYTSGTSGQPKGIVHAHRWLLGHNEFEVCHQLHPGEIFHGAGDWAWSLAKLLGPWRHGAAVFTFHQDGPYDPVALFRAMAAEGVSNVLLNPTMLRKLRSVMPDIGSHVQLPLRRAYCSSEPLSPELANWFTNQFGVPLRDYYGLTESYPMIGVLPGAEVPDGSIGVALPGWEVALLDDDFRQVPPDTPGEICLRARTNPQYPLGYWGRPADTETTFGGDWFRTGDSATQDADGHFYFLGRSDDVIITSGYRIGPYDLEAVINTHPAVSESAVVGDPDPERGQIVHAYIVLHPDQTPSPALTADIQNHVKALHSRFSYPRAIDYVASLPRSTTHKLQRSALRIHPQRAGMTAS